MLKDKLLEPSGRKCKCGNDIPIGRVKYSKNSHICTECDKTDRVGAIQVINGKVGNTIQITDKATSARINALQNRKGSIVGSGMRGTAKTTAI